MRFSATDPRADEHAALLDAHHPKNRALLGHLSAAEPEEVTLGTVRSEAPARRPGAG